MMKTRQEDKWTSGQVEKFPIFVGFKNNFIDSKKHNPPVCLSACLPSQSSPIFIVHSGIIGEATKKIPPEIRIKYQQIEWQKIAGLRDFIAHVYFSINTNIVWNIVQTKLDDLRICIQEILENEKLDI